MKVRLATMEDAGILATLIQDVQGLHADALPDIFKKPDDVAPFQKDFEERIFTNPNARIFIAEVDGNPAGYIGAVIIRRPENAYTYAMDFIHIDQISVMPAYRKQGCGRALIQAVFDLARSEGIERITLDTWAFNTEAHQFFARMGFTAFNIRMDTRLTKEAEAV